MHTPIRNGLVLYALFLIGVHSLAPVAYGACGAHFCPRIQEPDPDAWRAGWSMHRATFDIEGVSGTYSEAMLSLRYVRSDRIIAAFHIPFLALETREGDWTGFGNPMALAEFRWQPGPGHTLALGTQLEIPLGDDRHGLAQPHYMAVPYLTGAVKSGPFSLVGTGGLSFNFGGTHRPGTSASAHHGHAPGTAAGSAIFVHPHEDIEAMYRLSSGIEARALRARFEAFVSGQHVLVGNRDEDAGMYLSAGASIPLSFGRFELAPEGEFPVTAARRFEWTIGLRCEVRL